MISDRGANLGMDSRLRGNDKFFNIIKPYVVCNYIIKVETSLLSKITIPPTYWESIESNKLSNLFCTDAIVIPSCCKASIILFDILKSISSSFNCC